MVNSLEFTFLAYPDFLKMTSTCLFNVSPSGHLCHLLLNIFMSILMSFAAKLFNVNLMFLMSMFMSFAAKLSNVNVYVVCC